MRLYTLMTNLGKGYGEIYAKDLECCGVEAWGKAA